MSETNRAWALFFIMAVVYVMMVLAQPEEAVVEGVEGERGNEAVVVIEEREGGETEGSDVEVSKRVGEGGERAEGGRMIRVQTGKLEVWLNSVGAGVTRGVIKDYLYASGHERAGEAIVLFDGGEGDEVGGEYRVDTVGGIIELGKVVFTCDAEDEVSVASGDSVEVVFKARLGNGTEVIRSYQFFSDRHSFESRLVYKGKERVGAYELKWGIPLLLTESYQKMDRQNFLGLVMDDAELEKEKLGDVDNGAERVFEGPVDWVGARTRYFLLGIVPGERKNAEARVWGIGDEEDVRGFGLGLKHRRVEGAEFVDRVTFFVGPLDYKELRSIGRGMDECVDFVGSMLRPIAEVIFGVMVFLRKFIPSYGVVIIVISLLVKGAFWPLSKKSFESMARMRELSPRIKKIQERYRDNQQKQQQEVMKVYREEGVNPLGGCLPMVLQMPVLYALFIVFRSTIAFRGEPFLGYIADLSAPDPYWILPILMGVTMLAQQKASGQLVSDPRQKMMGYAMPVVFTFIFLSMPSGLVLYWTVSNVVSVLQQVSIGKFKKG
jgi:YidC/Oxa1 family membrane protein insertase